MDSSGMQGVLCIVKERFKWLQMLSHKMKKRLSSQPHEDEFVLKRWRHPMKEEILGQNMVQVVIKGWKMKVAVTIDRN